MAPRRIDHSLGFGVYYSADQYVGLGSRIVIVIVDAIVLCILLYLIRLLWFGLIDYFRLTDDHAQWFFGGCILVIWLYLTVLKRSELRTVGYQVTGARIVTLKGKKPSLFAMTVRELLWFFGPFSFVFDLIWCGIDSDQQTMRDRYAGTCLVRNKAVPIGEGPVHLAYYNAFGYTLIYPHVVHRDNATDKQ